MVPDWLFFVVVKNLLLSLQRFKRVNVFGDISQTNDVENDH